MPVPEAPNADRFPAAPVGPTQPSPAHEDNQVDAHTPTIGSDTPDEGTRDAVSESPSASTGCKDSSDNEEAAILIKAVEGTINWFEHPR